MTRIGDRFTYIPHIGLLIMVVWFVYEKVEGRELLKKAVRPLLIVSIILMIFMTRGQAETWRNSKTLFAQAIKINQDFHVTLNNIANGLSSEGRETEALEHYLAIIEEKPDFVPAYFNAGKLLVAMNQKNEARKMFQAVLELSPSNDKAKKEIEKLK